MGCALATTKKIGGRDVSRLALRRADAGARERLYCSGGVVPGAGHRREHRDLQFGERGSVASAARGATGSTGRDHSRQRDEWKHLVAPRLSGDRRTKRHARWVGHLLAHGIEFRSWQTKSDD